MKIFLSVTACCCAALPVTLSAQTLPVSDTTASSDIIVVSATRSPLARKKVGNNITVLTAENLRAIQTPHLIEALQTVPGVGVTRNGGVGGVSTVRIRGSEGEHTVVLLDGVKLNDPSSPGAGYDFANLLTNNIAQVEILRGPQSTLYGSQAIGGVINIVTRQGRGPTQVRALVEAGSLNSYQVNIDLSGGNDQWTYALATGHIESDSMSAFAKSAGGNESDGYENTGTIGRATYNISDTVSLDVRANYAVSQVGIDGFPPPNYAFADTLETSQSSEFSAYTGLSFNGLSGRLLSRMAFVFGQIEREATDPAEVVKTTFEARGANERIEGQVTFDWTDAFQLVAGFEKERTRYRTTSPSSFDPNPAPSRASNEFSALYVQALAKPTEGLTASLGVRQTENDIFGTATNVRATFAWTLNEGRTTFRASAGDGFKAPTLFQLFSGYGNLILVPEQSKSWEAGLEQNFYNGRVVGSLTWFHWDIENQIDFISCFNSSAPKCVNRPYGTYDNIGLTTAEGLEAALEAKLGESLRLSASYTSLEAKNVTRGSNNFGKALPRRPQASGHVAMSYVWKAGHDLSVSVTAVGDSYENAANTIRLKGYSLIALRGTYRLSENLDLTARIENLADEVYQTSFNYGSPPRQAFIGLRARF